MTKIFPSDCLSLSAFLVLLLFKQCRLRRSIRHGRHHAVAGGLWSGLASRLQRVYDPIAPRAVVWHRDPWSWVRERAEVAGAIVFATATDAGGFATGEMEAIFRQMILTPLRRGLFLAYQ